MQLTREGFYVPVLDSGRCLECGLCRRACPVLRSRNSLLSSIPFPKPIPFAGWSTDNQWRTASSSGGVFSELARPIIRQGGRVAGCIWKDKWTPGHEFARSWEQVESMRGSKYAPSRPDHVLRRVIEFLQDGTAPVLFSGTPCQVAAAAALLTPERRRRVLLVDFICHGVPSLAVFHAYLKGLFGGQPVVSYTFRDKTLHWQTIKAESANGRLYQTPASRDRFFRGFCPHHLYLMGACYDCLFSRLPRIADVTLGDFWSCPPEFHDPRGVSLVLANTERGLEALRLGATSRFIFLKEVPFATVSERRRLDGGGYTIPKARRAILDAAATGSPFDEIYARYFPTRFDEWKSVFHASDAKCWFLCRSLGKLFARGLENAFRR